MSTNDSKNKNAPTNADHVLVPIAELRWLLSCSDHQMADGDTARAMAECWLANKSAQAIITTQEDNV